MSSESSSDGTYSSESESVSSASDISSIPSLTAASSSSSAPPTTDGDSEFATDSEPEATASDSDSDSNPFGDLEESDSSTDDEDTEAPLEAVDPDFISATVDGMSAEDRAALAAAVGIEPDELATYVQHMHSMPRNEFAEIASRSAALAREVVARAGGRPQSIEQAGQLADEVIAEADEGDLDDAEGDEEEESPTEATGLRRRRQPIERVRRARRDVDALACFRWAERMANESPHRQDDVRWALAFHEMLELKLGEEEAPGPHRSWVGEDWLKLAEPCLRRPPNHDLGAKVKVDLARLALVAVAARQISRGRAGAEEPQPKWRLRWPVIATALVVDASVDADLDNVDLRVRAYVLRSHHREELSPPLRVAAASVGGEPHLLSPFMNPFANHRGNEIGWCIVACWAMMLLVRLEPKGWRGFPFALAALAAFASSRATGATTTSPVRAQRVWADRVNFAALLVAVFALVHLVAYYFRPPPWTMEWSVEGGFAVASWVGTMGLVLLLVFFVVLPHSPYEDTRSESGSRRPRRGGSHEYLLSFNAGNGCPTTTSNRLFADSRATVTCDGHGIYALRHRVVAFVTALVALEVFKVVPLWLHAALLLAFGTRFGFTLVPGAFWIASVMYSAVAGELDAAAYLFGLDGTCRGLSRIVGSRVAALVYAAGTLALASAYHDLLWVRYGNYFSWWHLCSAVVIRNIARTDDDPRLINPELRRRIRVTPPPWTRFVRRLHYVRREVDLVPRRFMNSLRGRAIIELGEPLFWAKLARFFWELLCLIASGVSMAYAAMRPGFLPLVFGSGCGGAAVSIWGWARIRNARRKAQRDVREAEDTVAKHKAAADDARKARESADARAAAAVKDGASAEARLRAAELARDDAVARAEAEVARADDGTDGAERWAARLAEADARRAAERDQLCADVAAAHAERDAARAALVGRAELEPRLRLALERRQLGTVADKFVVEGILDATAARRLTDDDFQRFGYLSFSLSSGPVADIRAAVNEAFGADLILEGGDPPKDLLCPLTLDLFEDPVVATDGHTYERAAIEKWFQSKTTSPLTNARITTELVPAHCVRSLADRYRVTVADPPPAPAPAAPDFTTPLLANSRAPQPTWTFAPTRAAAPAPALAAARAIVDQEDEELAQLVERARERALERRARGSSSGSSFGMPSLSDLGSSVGMPSHMGGDGGAPPPSSELGLPSDSYEESSSDDSDEESVGEFGLPSEAPALVPAPLASPRSRRAAQAARAAELRALAAATNSEVSFAPATPATPATPAPPPAQLVMGGPLPRQPARAASDPELVVGADPEMEHPPAVTPDAAN